MQSRSSGGPGVDKEGDNTPREPVVPIVAVGASAGGLEPLQAFVRQCPPDAGCAFVILQHLPPDGESELAHILAQCTDLPVAAIDDDHPVMANQVYVLKPGYAVTVSESRFRNTELPEKRGYGTGVIDTFMHSIAEAGELAIGVVLSGTGTDGADGIGTIREMGGMTLAQSLEKAQFAGMPEAATHAGLVDYVGAAQDMPEQIRAYLHNIRRGEAGASDGDDRQDRLVGDIAALLAREHGNDFQRYKSKTVIRRIRRRMSLKQIADMADYLEILRESADERFQLYKDLLISVTGFFRDPLALASLDEGAIRELIEEGDAGKPLRIWIPGCATGEEAYTLAILCHERMRQSGRERPLQIFASDIDERALRIARAGVYPDSIKNHLAADLITRYFTSEGSYYQVRKAIREDIVFASHNLITSAPFSQLDLISCRNLLIYLKTEIQSEIMGLFHFALNDGGYLFLGSAESVAREDNLFTPVARTARLFRRKTTHRRVTPNLPFTAGAPTPVESQRTPSNRAPTQARLGERVQRHLLEHYAPPAILVSADGDILYYLGDTSAYLRQPSGQPSHNLFDVGRTGIRSQLRNVFRTQLDSNEPVRLSLTGPKRGDGDHGTAIVVTPLAINQLTLYLITFEQLTGGQVGTDEPAGIREEDVDQGDPALIHQLEDELASTRSELFNTIEDLEISNQDLKTANEEAVSMNEELQSTNEELETSKEELQSLNEELVTVNTELKTKVDQLDVAYSDLDNLLKSISAATLFVDLEGFVRLFTPNCRDLLHLVDTDIGRPLDEIKFRINDEQLLEDLAHTRNTLQTREQDIGSDGKDWYMRRTTPYRAGGNRIDGVVVTYTNVTRLREAQRELKQFADTLEQRVAGAVQEREAFFKAKEKAARQRDAFLELSPAPLFVISRDFTFSLVNDAWERDLGWPVAHFYDKKLPQYIHPDDWASFQKRLRKLSTGQKTKGIRARALAQDGTYHWLEWDAKWDDSGYYFGSGRDISDQVQSARALTSAQNTLKNQLRARSNADRTDDSLAHATLMCLGEAVVTTNTLGTVTSINPMAEHLIGQKADDVVGTGVDEVLVLLSESTHQSLPNPVKQVLRRKKSVAVKEAALLVRADGREIVVEASVSPVMNDANELLGTVTVFFDMSYSRQITEDMQYRATHDSLTGLVNRGEFEKRLESAVSGVQDSTKSHCLLYLDLDRFKIINDTCGHFAGDELLRQLSRDLQKHVRQRDTLARLGGDEFGLILENCLPGEAERIAEDILTLTRSFRFVWEDRSFQLGISIGIITVDRHTVSPEKLLGQADNACYMAKEAGRNRAHFFDLERVDEQHQKSVMYWASRVTQALEDDTLELVAQPILALTESQATGNHFELLARLNDEDGDGRLIVPSHFLPAAERYNLMPSLDHHVVKKAFAWLAANPQIVSNLSLCSINLSAASLEDDRFPELLRNLLVEHELPPEKICFEITETLAITNLAKTIAMAEEFKRQGFMFSLDDFGSGFSSYHYLKRLPVDFLKIDGEFVRGILTDPIDEAMVRSMNEIGHIMGKKTIAEYVESTAVLEKLREMGVDYVQGYLTGMPDSLLQFNDEYPQTQDKITHDERRNSP